MSSISEGGRSDRKSDDVRVTYFSEERIPIPRAEKNVFSFKKLWAFTGPGFLVSIAFLDPGNIEADHRTGAIARYKLLWVLLTVTCLGLLMQRLSARLGVVSGLHLAEMCHRQFEPVPRLVLWIMTEIAIIGSDMQEVIGTAIALHLLTNRVLPLWAGVVITIIDTFTFLFLDRYGLRKLELLFGFFIATMAISFGYEYVVAAPPQLEVLKGFVPWCENCGAKVMVQAVGIIGANIQPHNLYLHSALVKTRNIDRKQHGKVREANMYYFVEAAIALFVSFLINVFVMAAFAHLLFDKSNANVYNICEANNFTQGTDVFVKNNASFEADLYKSGVFLGCRYGFAALIIWAIGVLAAGQSAAMTGTYAGQFAMVGFLNLTWPKWKRVLLTRSIAIVPTFLVAFFKEIHELTGMNDILNVLMSFQLPFAALPLIAFTSSSNVMGEFKNGVFNRIFATLLSLYVIAINTFLIIKTLMEIVENSVYYGTPLIVIILILAFFYLTFYAYLLVYLAMAMGATSSFINKYISGPTTKNLDKHESHYG